MSRKLRLRQKKWFSYKKKSMYREYVLHQDYSTSTTLADEKCVNVVIEYVTKHGKHFDQDNSRKLTNIVTNSQIGHQSSTFFLSVEKMRTKTSTRLARLVDKRREREHTEDENLQAIYINHSDVWFKKGNCLSSDIKAIQNHETMNWLRDLLQFELTFTSLFLTKEGYLGKPVKSDLALDLNKMIYEKTEAVVRRCSVKKMFLEIS